MHETHHDNPSLRSDCGCIEDTPILCKLPAFCRLARVLDLCDRMPLAKLVGLRELIVSSLQNLMHVGARHESGQTSIGILVPSRILNSQLPLPPRSFPMASLGRCL